MRFTPLNIASACLVAWFVMENPNDEKALFTWGAFILLLLILTVVDIVFRVFVKQNKKMWLLQLAFLVVVCVTSLIVKVTFA
ncbi:MAG: hypothetical protein LBV59_14795 [Sphingobacterium sp.]|uniref:hypothetical protein n=1 Tax=unclassified Sphingobacterium TaxID=2609468 RepID=UPI002846FC1D|nr:hypothetical protein [Sphingobacterium sp.]MDR3009202.1 hypothetical protein [Sphingobacterium sp.]